MGVRRLFAQSRFKQLILILAINLGLENIYSNYLLADATTTTRLAVLNNIRNNLITSPVFKPAFISSLGQLTSDLNTALTANTVGDPNLFKPGDLNGNNAACASGASNCQCLVSGLCVVKLTPLALANYTALNLSAQPSPYPAKESYENLILSLLYAGSNITYALNQAPPDGKGYVLPFGTPANTATLTNLLANFMVPDSTTYPGLALDKTSGLLIKTPAFCQALLTANPLNQVTPTANNIWLGAICTNNSHCCGTNICDTTSVDLGQDSGGNKYGYCEFGCSKFNQTCTSDADCCTAAESDSPVVCDLTVKKCVSCVVAGDGCFANTDCCAAQNLKCDESSMTCVSCVSAGDKAAQAADCCPETAFNNSTKTCDSTCGLLNSSCKTSTDCCTSQGLTCDRISKTCLLDVGRACDPKDSAKNHNCRNGLSCDSNTQQCEINLGSICAATPDNCLTGLVCDQLSMECRQPLNSNNCTTDEDCIWGYICDNPQKAATGTCKLKSEASCTSPFKATDCATSLTCGYASGSTDGKHTCCAAAGSDYGCAFDSDCCGGALCDGTSGVYKCVECIPDNNQCAGIEGRCCAGLYCDSGSGLCVPLADCPAENTPCNKYSDCGGSSCHLVCNYELGQCKLYGNLGTECDSDDNCKVMNYETGNLEYAGFSCRENSRAEVINGVSREVSKYSCCAPLGVACQQDADCCDDTGGTVSCINDQCVLACIADGQLCGANFPKANGPTVSGVTCCKTNDAGQALSCQDQQGKSFCGTTLKAAGETCTENNQCDGYDDRASASTAECNASKKCCSLTNGSCEQDDDCCDHKLSCQGKKCILDEEAWVEELEIAGGEVGAVSLAVLAVKGIRAFKQRAGLEYINKLSELFGFAPEDRAAMVKFYDPEIFAKDGAAMLREYFATTVVAALNNRYRQVGTGGGPTWSTMAQNAGLNVTDFNKALVQVVVTLIEQASGDSVAAPTAETAAAGAAIVGRVELSMVGQIGDFLRKKGITGRGLLEIAHMANIRSGGRAAMKSAVEKMTEKLGHTVSGGGVQPAAAGEAASAKCLSSLFEIAKIILAAEIASKGEGDTSGMLGTLAQAGAELGTQAEKLAPATPAAVPIKPLDADAIQALSRAFQKELMTDTKDIVLIGENLNADKALSIIGKNLLGEKLSLVILLEATKDVVTDYKDILNKIIDNLNSTRADGQKISKFTDAVDKAVMLTVLAGSLGDFPDTANAPSIDFMTQRVGTSMRAVCTAIATSKDNGITAEQVYAKLYEVGFASERSELKQMLPDWRTVGEPVSARVDLPHPI